MQENIEVTNPNQENHSLLLNRRMFLSKIAPAALSLFLLSKVAPVGVFADTVPENKGEPTPPPTEEPAPVITPVPERPRPPVVIPPKPAPPPPQPPRSPFVELINNEKSAWRQVLGINVDVPDLPSAFYPDSVRQKLEYYGLGLRYIPALNLGTINDLGRLGTSTFLDGLQGRYPNWAHFERLNIGEQDDYRKVKNLHEYYWDNVRTGSVVFPVLPGQWVAVETSLDLYRKDNMDRSIEQPSPLRDLIKKSSNLHPADDGFSSTMIKINSILEPISSELVLQGRITLRLLEAIEWNLLANREGWAKPGLSTDWTNTEYFDPSRPEKFRLTIGHNGDRGYGAYGGAASTFPTFASFFIIEGFGYRVALFA